MNILVLINPAKNYKSFYYKLSQELQLRGHSIYYAVDSSRSKYMDPIDSIDNNDNTYYFDIYFEKNYNNVENIDLYQSSWGESLFSDIDRVVTRNRSISRSSEYWTKAKYSLDCFFSDLIVNNDIDFVIYENVSNSFEYSAYRVAEKYNKKYLGLASSRIPNRYELQTSIIDREVELISNLKTDAISDEEMAWYARYRDSILHIQPDYMTDNQVSKVTYKDILSQNNLKKLIRSVNSQNKYSYEFDYINGNPLHGLLNSLVYTIKRNLNKRRSENCYLSNQELKDGMAVDDYYVYPMHYHPESSTSVLAPTYTDEFNNILNISNNLPFGTYLYVKDHASAVGVQNVEFYKKVSLLPAVKLVHYNQNIKKIIMSSKGVITVNSTAGYEALILNKPVVLLGRVFYERFYNVHKANGFSDIYNIVDAISLNDIHSSEEIAKDIIAYYRYTYEGSLQINATSHAKRYFFDLVNNIFHRLKLG